MPQDQEVLHLQDRQWLETPNGDPRGYIQPHTLTELWFHTGTTCNLSCPFCLEGSKPGDNRLEQMTAADVKPFVDEAVQMGVQQFSFTGGEPFVIKEIFGILDYALEHKPCLVLTNATRPLSMRIDQLKPFLAKKNKIQFRVSFDFPDAKRHDASRGQGNFHLSWETIKQLHDLGFTVSVARHREQDENVKKVDNLYRKLFQRYGIPKDTNIVSFPDFATPGSILDVPHITEDCMTRYHSEEGRRQFMCAYSKMIVKKDGRMRVYACTLVDDDEDYDLGETLDQSMAVRIMMKHHRCYSCFAYGASCSEKK